MHRLRARREAHRQHQVFRGSRRTHQVEVGARTVGLYL